MSTFQTRLFLRIIAKNREVYLLKIITLAIAFACSTLIALFSLNEFGYDRFHRNNNSVFRVLQRNNDETYSGNRLSTRIPVEVFSALQSRSADSMIISRIKVMNELSILAGKQIFQDQKIHATDPEITHIFSFDILDGSVNEFHESAQAVMLSSSTALKFFGTIQATGKKIKICAVGDTLLFSVVAVYKDYPKNSHEEFNSFIRFDTLSLQSLKFNHRDAGVYGRALHHNTAHLETEINNLLQPTELVYKFQPISEIYFGPRVMGEDAKHGDHYSIVILICITALIFFLALTNFVNLTTLTLPHRSKELAVKKLAGASQLNLVFTFAKESFYIVGISFVLGILLLVLTSDLVEPILSLSLISLLIEGDVLLILIMTGLTLILGIVPLFMTFKFTKPRQIAF